MKIKFLQDTEITDLQEIKTTFHRKDSTLSIDYIDWDEEMSTIFFEDGTYALLDNMYFEEYTQLGE